MSSLADPSTSRVWAHCCRQIAVPVAVIVAETAFWFFAVQLHIVLSGSEISARENCTVSETHVPPTTLYPDGHVAVQDELAPAPVLLGPVHVT